MNTTNITNASVTRDITEESDAPSIFIHSPTYSVIDNEKLYFVDNFDKLLKVYDLNPEINKFESKYISLELIGNIIDIYYINSNLYILSAKNEETTPSLYFTIINLTSFQIIKHLKIDTIDTNYNKLDVCESITHLYISLTPITNNNLSANSPIILTYDKTQQLITNICTIEIDESINNELFNISVLLHNDTTDQVYVAFTYNDTISFFSCYATSITQQSNYNIDISKGTVFDDLETKNSNVKLVDVNMIKINNKDYYIITYNDISENRTCTHIYNFNLGEGVDGSKEFTSVYNFSIENDSYLMTSNEYLIYPRKNTQQILYHDFDCIEVQGENNGLPNTNTKTTVSNPTVNKVFKTEDQFEYATINKKTSLLASPWDSTSILEIDPSISSKDVIIIGAGQIQGENHLINDYKYCLFTTGDKNNFGYIKTEDLTLKQKISLDQNNYEYEYIKFKVQPNTILYSMPTTILGEYLTAHKESESKVVMCIPENSIVTVIDAICRYKSNEKIMLKVKVNNNDDQIGYIEYDKIIKPSDITNFVITNSSIKNDNTNIYLGTDSTSPIICTLNEGYRVRINGSRNTQTGYTSVTFNDEYGNEINGYILTDSLESDSWTVMQIIGCILIAINIGLLILILRFKHKSIGVNGAKYIDSAK